MAIKIYIDQGHNPVNPNAGAEGNGLREQNLVYAIGIELARMLRENPNFEVRLSRPTAETQLGTTKNSSLAARVNDANSWGADYFISLHTNASTSPFESVLNPTLIEESRFSLTTERGLSSIEITESECIIDIPSRSISCFTAISEMVFSSPTSMIV